MGSECVYFEFYCRVRPSSESFLDSVIQYLVVIFNCLVFMRLRVNIEITYFSGDMFGVENGF